MVDSGPGWYSNVAGSTGSVYRLNGSKAKFGVTLGDDGIDPDPQ
jgi:hypothetical protein